MVGYTGASLLVEHADAAGLTPGRVYRLAKRGTGKLPSDGRDYEWVTFVGFTPYPATVIVVDRQQRRIYCGRERLFAAG